MLIGHFAVAAAVKAKEPEVPLWSLMVGTQLLDLFYVPLYISGVETMEPVAAGGGAIIHADYTHSLVGALLIALVAGGLAWRAWGRRPGLVLGGMVFSHWLLDLLVHYRDLPILPGNLGKLPLLGLGLWGVPGVSSGLELLLILAGTVAYWRSAVRRARAAGQPASRAVTAGVVLGALLVATFVADLAGLG
jgi:membrane-bound metal-dependent hydrolase YbcI (DUF457 family)